MLTTRQFLLLISFLFVSVTATAQSVSSDYFLVSQKERLSEQGMHQVNPGIIINLHVDRFENFVIKNDCLRKDNIVKLMGEAQEGKVITIINKDNGRVFAAGQVIESMGSIQLIHLFGEWHPAQADQTNEGWILARQR